MNYDIEPLHWYPLLSPLSKAVLDGDTEAVDELLASGADPIVLEPDGWSPICNAIRNGEQQYFIKMLPKVKRLSFSSESCPANVDCRDGDAEDTGISRLKGALRYGLEISLPILSIIIISPIILTLIKRFLINPSPITLSTIILSELVRSLIMMAWRYHRLPDDGRPFSSIVRFFSEPQREVGEEIRCSLRRYGGESEDMLLAFVTRIVNPEFTQSHPKACHSLLIDASCRGYTRVTEALLSRGVGVDSHGLQTDDYHSMRCVTPEEWACTPIFFAALEGNADTIVILLGHGASVEGAPENPMGSPLVAAAAGARGKMCLDLQKRYERCISILLKAGAEPNAVDRNGCTALWWLTCAFHLNTIHLLLKYGADPNKPNNHGITPLYRALEFGSGHVAIRALLEAGVDPNIPEEHGMTLLHLACQFGCSQREIQALLEAGVDPNIPDKQGMTPLHKACEFESGPQTIRTLIEAGADPNIQDMYGLTPLHRSWRFSYIHHHVALTLRELGADPNIPDKRGRFPRFQFDRGDDIADIVDKEYTSIVRSVSPPRSRVVIDFYRGARERRGLRPWR